MAALVAIVALAVVVFLQPASRPRILLAPMVGLDACVSPPPIPFGDAKTRAELHEVCAGPDGSAAALLEQTLSGLEGKSGAKRYEVGYTLNIPLLKLFEKEAGGWVVDPGQLGRAIRTLRDTERPVILYLFSTHFQQYAPIEGELSKDPANLSWTRDGPLPVDKYYGDPLYNWSFASMDTAITARRLEAAKAVITEICKLEPRHVAKIRGVTLLGELHHLFPDFEAGMGFKPPYRISDYSTRSKADFRVYMQQRFASIDQLNQAVGAQWASFDQLEPPSKDVRTEPLRDFTEHIDSYAHGILPISGWAWTPTATDASPAHVRIYRDGELLARVPASLGRQDVLAALPELGSANTGWRFDMDFKSLAAGIYRLDIYLENRPDDLIHLGTRNISIMDRQQQTPMPRPMKKVLPPTRYPDAATRAYVDVPDDQTSYFYNPLVPYWHAFRAQQVLSYIQKFSQALDPQCLKNTPRFTHQIIPFTNPGWDETKFAIDASLEPIPGIGLGVSLYGEPTYGDSFTNWLAKTKHTRYGITEFHPLKPLTAQQMQAVLQKHEDKGAEFLSFFMEPRWKGQYVSHGHNLFSFDPANVKYGGAQLYEAVQGMLAEPAR